MDNRTAEIKFNDLDELVQLHGKYLNNGLGLRSHFEEVLRNPSTIGLKYLIKGEIAGLLVYVKGIHVSGGEGKHKEIQNHIKMLTNGKNVYTGDALLVCENYRKLGISEKLYAALITEMRQRKVDLALNELWVYPDGKIPAMKNMKVFSKNTFIGRYENFYRRSECFDYVCPVCTEDCVCAAEIYLSEI